MIVKRFHCPGCRKLLQTSVRRIRMVCPACATRFRPGGYRLAVKKGGEVGRIEQVMGRSWN